MDLTGSQIHSCFFSGMNGVENSLANVTRNVIDSIGTYYIKLKDRLGLKLLF